jgi:uncharacterized NAD-dependent epimerase/dehydratase family protein
VLLHILHPANYLSSDKETELTFYHNNNKVHEVVLNTRKKEEEKVHEVVLCIFF